MCLREVPVPVRNYLSAAQKRGKFLVGAVRFEKCCKSPVTCMFPSSEYQTWLVFVLLYSTTLWISSIPIPVHSTHSAYLWTLNLCHSHLHTHTWNHSGTLLLFWHIPETQFITSIWNPLDMTEGRQLKPTPGTLCISELPTLTSEELEQLELLVTVCKRPNGI